MKRRGKRGKFCGVICDEALARLVGAGSKLVSALEEIAECRDHNDAVKTAQTALDALKNVNLPELAHD